MLTLTRRAATLIALTLAGIVAAGLPASAAFAWPPSATPAGVTGYRVTAHVNNGTNSVLGTTDAATQTLTVTSDTSDLTYQPRVTVTTLTSYGWTAESAESAKSAVLTC